MYTFPSYFGLTPMLAFACRSIGFPVLVDSIAVCSREEAYSYVANVGLPPVVLHSSSSFQPGARATENKERNVPLELVTCRELVNGSHRFLQRTLSESTLREFVTPQQIYRLSISRSAYLYLDESFKER